MISSINVAIESLIKRGQGGGGGVEASLSSSDFGRSHELSKRDLATIIACFYVELIWIS